MGSQFAIGFITSFTGGLGGGTAVTVSWSGGVTMFMSGVSDWLEKNTTMSNIERNIVTSVADDILSDGAKSVTIGTMKGITQNVATNAPYISNAAASTKLAVSGILKDNPIHSGFGRYFAMRNLKNIKPQKY